jgi:hypothetical protein
MDGKRFCQGGFAAALGPGDGDALNHIGAAAFDPGNPAPGATWRLKNGPLLFLVFNIESI